MTVTASGIENEDRVNPMKEMKQLAHIDTECSEQSNKRALKSCSDIHLLSDLRGLTNADEKNTLYYAVAFYCSGGDSASQKFEKKYNNENKNIYTDSAQTLGVQNALATSSNSTTIMDFLRYEVHTVRYYKDLIDGMPAGLTTITDVIDQSICLQHFISFTP